MRTTFPNERSTPLDLTRSCSRGAGCGGVSAYHAPSRASRMRGIFKTDDISASCIAVIFVVWGDHEARAYRYKGSAIEKRQASTGCDEEGEQRSPKPGILYAYTLEAASGEVLRGGTTSGKLRGAAYDPSFMELSSHGSRRDGRTRGVMPVSTATGASKNGESIACFGICNVIWNQT